MNRIVWNKFLYAVYTPFVRVTLLLKGIEFNGRSYWNGFPSIDKNSDSSISIGTGSKFVSRHTGNRLGIYHPCMLTTARGAKLRIGEHCGFSGVAIWCFDKIEIGNHVRVGANVLIMDGDAHQDDPRAGKNKPVLIEDNVWIGANVVIKKGVHIGRNAVIGINSVVSNDIPENCIAIGNPCVVVKNFSDEEIKEVEKYFA